MTEPPPPDPAAAAIRARWMRGPVDLVLSFVVVLSAVASPLLLPLGVLAALMADDLSGQARRARSPSRWIVASSVIVATLVVWSGGSVGGWWWVAAASAALALLVSSEA